MLSQINRVILKSLESGDKYGLEIIKDIEVFTNGKVIVKQPTLYSSLRRMEKKGFITSFWQDSAFGGRRHYYSLTNSGKAEIQDATEQMSEQDIDALLQELNKNSKSTPKDEPIQEIVLDDKVVEPEAEEKPVIAKNEPVIKNKVAFEKFDPQNSVTRRNSFSQEMRQYSEPDAIVEQPAPTLEQKSTILSNKQNNTEPQAVNNRTFSRSEPEVEFFEQEIPKQHSKDEINYKDILGELDASNSFNEPSPFTYSSNFAKQQSQTQEKVTLQKKAPYQKTQFTKEIEQILTSPARSTSSTQKSKTTMPPLQERDRSILEEINRRYNLQTSTNEEPTAFVPTYDTNYKYIKQEKLSVKQYSKTDSNTTLTKNFLNVNKFNLCRAIIMVVLYIAELLGAYFIVRNYNLLYEPHSYMYWVAMGFSAIYLAVMFLVCFQDINKKVRLKEIKWGLNLIYRLLFTIVLFTFVISVCLCLGMNNFIDVEFFTLWLIPAIAISNILLSWLVGLIIYSTKKFRA